MNNSGRGRARRRAAKWGMVWDNEKVQWRGAGDTDDGRRTDATMDGGRNGIQSKPLEDRQLRLDAGRHLECITRLAARLRYIPTGRQRELQQSRVWAKEFRRKNVVVREGEHMGYERLVRGSPWRALQT